MITRLGIQFKDIKEFEYFVTTNADKVEIESISSGVLAEVSYEFITRFSDHINLTKLFVESIKKGLLDRVEFCLDNGVDYYSQEVKKQCQLMTFSSYEAIEVAFDYCQFDIIDFFIENGYVDTEIASEFIVSVIEKYDNNSYIFNGPMDIFREKSIHYIDLMFKNFDVDVNYSGGIFINQASRVYSGSVLKLLKYLIEDRKANLDYLEIMYHKDKHYSSSVIKFLNNYLDDINQIDFEFFSKNKYS